VNRHLAIAIVLSALAIGLALVSGVHRRAAVIGAASASITALGSMMAMTRAARTASKPTQAALAVMVLGFFVRLVLVAVGTILVVRAGESVVGFIVAFFVPYFALAIVEGALVHSLRRGTGPTA
jgi:hypothetical protein